MGENPTCSTLDVLLHCLPMRALFPLLSVLLRAVSSERLLTREKLQSEEQETDITNYLKFLKIFLYECFTCMYVCVPCTSMVSTEARRGNQMPWNWSYKWL